MPATVADDEPELVGRCYTKARRAPLVYGVIRDVRGGQGIRLPGGPYTLTQLATIITTVALLLVTRPLWGGHGWVDAALLVALPFAASFAVRQLHVDGRNPLAAMASVITMLAAPRSGRLRGKACRPSRATHTATVITLGEPGAGPEAVKAPPAPAPEAPAAPEGPKPSPARPPTTGPRRPAAPASGVARGTGAQAPVVSGVQALLARRTSSKD
ncbi:hypothetical protein AB0M94_35525 [Streptomyces xanthochromogenes]|uniref:hypothetical protein n=1 Tax=Streptomyces xanthochromogenes TaxID=67384 RepID=UPI00343535A4